MGEIDTKQAGAGDSTTPPIGFSQTCQTGLEETLEESSDVAAQLGSDLGCLLGARSGDPEGLEWVPGEKVCLEKEVVKVRQHRRPKHIGKQCRDPLGFKLSSQVSGAIELRLPTPMVS